jgi:hypothetical protein
MSFELDASDLVHLTESNTGQVSLTPLQEFANFLADILPSTPGTYSDEDARDAIGAALVEGAGIDIVVSDPGDTITISSTITQYTDGMADVRVATGIATHVAAPDPHPIYLTQAEGDALYASISVTQYTDEMAQDTVAVLIQNGTGITWVYSDAGNTLTPTISLAAFTTTNLAEGANLYYTDERVDDRVAALLVEGAGIDLSYNDGAGTLTIVVDLSELSTTTLPEGSNLYYTDERVDDRINALFVEGPGIDFSYNDPANTFTVTVDLSELSTTTLPEGTNLYYTDGRADARVAIGIAAHVAAGDPHTQYLKESDFVLTTFDTDDLAEGATNLYFTAQRANNAALANTLMLMGC